MIGLLKFLFWSVMFGVINIIFFSVVGLSVLYQKLPSLDVLIDYRPRLPMRIYSAEGDIIGEFGEEKRAYRTYQDFPQQLVGALLATEDVRFFEHVGLDFVGIGRAALGWLEGRREGASTITMQVARNFYLARDRTLVRKITEAMLALEIERHFTKQQILERYMNQIYLGQGSFGFGSAARIYFDKDLDELTTGEIALLAGLPKAPSRYNPRRHRTRAQTRQAHVLGRMLASDVISAEEHEELILAGLPSLRSPARQVAGDNAYAAEEVRRLMFEHFGDEAYERGLNIYTTIQSRLQSAAAQAVRKGLLTHQARRR